MKTLAHTINEICSLKYRYATLHNVFTMPFIYLFTYFIYLFIVSAQISSSYSETNYKVKSNGQCILNYDGSENAVWNENPKRKSQSLPAA